MATDPPHPEPGRLAGDRTISARAGAFVSYRTVRIPGPRVAGPLPHLADLWQQLGLRPEGVVAMQSSTPGRLLFAVCQGKQMVAVVKVGSPDDAALRHESAMLMMPMQFIPSIVRPQVLWSGLWRDQFVLATHAVRRAARAPWTPRDVVPVAEALATAGPDGAPITHGDLAPWNLVRSAGGLVLLDWEFARFADEPLHDLAHFIVQGGALLGRYRPDEAVALLCEHGSPGEQLLAARGRDSSEARPMLADYLAQARPVEPRAVRFRAEMLRLVPT